MTPSLTHVRVLIGAVAALVLVIAGLCAFVHAPKAQPGDIAPVTPLPAVTEPLGPHFNWAPPTT